MAAACAQPMAPAQAAKEFSLSAFAGMIPTVSTRGCRQDPVQTPQPTPKSLMFFDGESSEDSAESASAAPAPKELTRARAVALQHELLVMYRSPNFQKKLQKLPKDENEHFKGFRKLVRGVQMEVLRKYGFEASDDGLKELHACFSQFADDTVVSAMSASISKLLSGGMDKKEDKNRKAEDSMEMRGYLGALMDLGPMPTSQAQRISKMNKQRSGRTLQADVMQKAIDQGAAQTWKRQETPTQESAEDEVSECEDVPLTKARAEYALSELEGAFSARRFQKKLEEMDSGKQPPFELHFTKKGNLEVQLAAGIKELAQPVFAAILPSYGIAATEKGVRQFWRAVKPHADSDDMLWQKANTVLRKLQSSRRELFRETPDLIDQKPRRIVDEDAQSRLSLQRAIDLETELLEQYSSVRFQTQLNTIHRTYSPSSKAFGKRLQEILLEVYEEVLPRFGFTADDDGLVDFTMEMGPHWGVPEVQVLAGAIDAALYGVEEVQEEALRDQAAWEDEESEEEEQSKRHLNRQEVLRLLREQVTTFGRPSFQKRVEALKEAMGNNGKDGSLHQSGRRDLAMIVQKRILPKYGLPPTDFGAHSMFLQCMRFIMDPEVARLTIVINKLLGMHLDAAKSYVTRLRILQEDATP